MPRTYLSERQRITARIQRMIIGQMAVLNLKQKDLAAVWGITQPAAGYKIRNGAITIAEFIEANKVLQFTDGEMLEMLRGKEK